MKALVKLTWTDLKLYCRNFIAIFFVLLFPLLMLFLYGNLNGGNQPSEMLGGRGMVDFLIPGYIASIVVGTAAFMNLPIDLAARRQEGVLRRMRVLPIRPTMVLASTILVNLLISLAGCAVLIGFGKLVFDIHLPTNPLPLLAGFVVICIALFTLGFVLASLFSNVSTTRSVSMIVFYPLIFLSGGTIPLQVFPENIRNISTYLPLTYAVNLLNDLWFQQSWNLTALAVLAGMTVLGLIVSFKMFRWE